MILNIIKFQQIPIHMIHVKGVSNFWAFFSLNIRSIGIKELVLFAFYENHEDLHFVKSPSCVLGRGILLIGGDWLGIIIWILI